MTPKKLTAKNPVLLNFAKALVIPTVQCHNYTDGGNGFDTYFDALKWVIFD